MASDKALLRIEFRLVQLKYIGVRLGRFFVGIVVELPNDSPAEQEAPPPPIREPPA